MTPRTRSLWLARGALCVLVAERALAARVASAQTTTLPAPAPASTAADGAATDGPRAARQTFEEGVRLYDEGRVEEALRAFERAHALHPSFKLLAYIGDLALELHDYARAVLALEAYLAEGGARVPPEKRTEIEAKIASAKQHVESRDRRAGAARTGDPVAEPRAALPAGAGEKAAPPASSALSSAGGEPTAPSHGRGHGLTTLSWIGIGASGALAAGALVTGALAMGASSELNRPGFAATTPNEAYEAQRQQVRDLALATDILAAAAVVTAATTLYFTLTRHPAAVTPSAAKTGRALRVDVGPLDLRLHGTF